MNLNSTGSPRGITANGVRTWGFLFLFMGLAGQSILQNQILGMGQVSTQELLSMLDAKPELMGVATLALIFQAIQTCAVPIFAFLTAEGFLHSSDRKQYLVRVLALAVACEIPYNLAMSGRVFQWESRNPVFGVVLCLVTMMLWNQYPGKGWKNVAIKAVIAVAAVVWAGMLGIAEGAPLVVMCLTFWAMREKPTFRNMAGVAAAGCCTMFSMYYLLAPMGVFALYMFNGERGAQNRMVNYGAYPVFLIVIAVVSMFL